MSNDGADTQLHRGQLGERIADLLENEIVAEEWATGSLLPSEGELCGRFEVSKPIVREALRILTSRGLVRTHQGRGTVILEPNADSYAHAIRLMLLRSDVTVGNVLMARAILESAVAAEAAMQRSEKDITKLRGHLEDFAGHIDGGDYGEVLRSHSDFHAAILEAAHQPAMEVLLAPMNAVIVRSSVPANPADPDQWILDLHVPILDAIAAGDPNEAANAMRRHFTEVVEGPHFKEAATELFRRGPWLQTRDEDQVDIHDTTLTAPSGG